ncbi:MAG: 1-acyl-sn-glycerol-3-phosphate acyltransferase [Hyphomicrobiales bacterium]|nr:1-acyl-sn-glycerol-3-phosphate acyltransferase [Hyphomicrobiales bacterium]
MLLLIRSLVFNCLFYINLVGLLVIGLPTLALPRRFIFELARLWARSSLWLLKTVCGTDFEFRGRENIPATPFIVAAKHQSIWETFALTLLFDDFCYILKRELTYIPFFGWYLLKSGQVAIDRKSGSSALAQAAERARQIFAQNRVLFIFPEGTRRPAGAPPKYKFGVAFIYEQSGVPCLPIALNSGLFWARRSWLRRPGTIVLDILAPIAPGLEKEAFLELLQDRIEAASNKLLDEALSKGPALSHIIQKNRQIA